MKPTVSGNYKVADADSRSAYGFIAPTQSEVKKRKADEFDYLNSIDDIPVFSKLKEEDEEAENVAEENIKSMKSRFKR